MAYALPLTQPDHCNDQRTPHIMEWLRKIWDRPAAKQTFAKGRTLLASRIKILDRSPAP